MTAKAVLLAATVLVSAVAMGASAPAVAADPATPPPAADGSADVPTATDEATPTDETTATDGNDSDDATDDRGSLTLSSEALRNFTVNTSSLPASVGAPTASATVGSPAANLTPGTVRYFLTADRATSEFYFKEFTLRRVGEHGEIWVANDMSWPGNDSRADPEVSDAQLDYLMEEFDGNIYPTESDLFREPQPRYGNESGLAANGQVPQDYYVTDENESRTVILVDNIRDENYYNASYPIATLGFYSSTIEETTDRNVVTVDGYDWDNRTGGPESPWRPPGGTTNSYLIEGIFAHEYQHLLHADQDPDETTWVNEALSNYAMDATGYGAPRSHIETYEQLPSNSLVEWGDQGDVNILADYGGAYLFHLYGYERYGEAFIEEVFADADNDIASVNDALDAVGSSENFTTLYQDFSAALVGDAGTDGPAPYRFDDAELDVNTTDEVPYTRDQRVASWGNAYEPIDVSGNATVESVTVSGIDSVPTRWEPTDDPAGGDETVLWSGTGDNLDNAAVFGADLTNTSSPTLAFETYYDIERGYDYGFVQVSTDGGDTWRSLSNANTTDYRAEPQVDPRVAENLPGFTGDTNGEWRAQTFDLSAYAGQEVLVGFRYITDLSVQGNSSEVPGTGMYVRDVSVPGTNVSYDGSSVAPFRSIEQVRGDPVGYQYSVLGLTEAGEVVEVKQYPVRTFPDGGTRTLTDLPSGENASRLLLAVTRASEQGDYGTVPYDYEVTYAGDGPSEPGNATSYQVDFVAGEPYERVGGEYPLYAAEDRLLRFAFGNTTAGITDRGSAWASESLRACVDYGHIRERDDGTASVRFTVAAHCSNVTLSLAVYEKPAGPFDPAVTQTLVTASTDSYAPGTHTVAVDLPDGETTATG